VGAEERNGKPHYGTVNFEKRKHPRFSVDLPVEYRRIGLLAERGRAVNASEGGLLLYLPEPMGIGTALRLKVFFTMGSELNAIAAMVEVVWVDMRLEKDRGDYRMGVKFVEISTEDVDKLNIFLRSLSA